MNNTAAGAAAAVGAVALATTARDVSGALLSGLSGTSSVLPAAASGDSVAQRLMATMDKLNNMGIGGGGGGGGPAAAAAAAAVSPDNSNLLKSDLNFAAAAFIQEGFVSSFITSYFLIAASELGDKTFFIAALMSMRNNAWVVLAAALSALSLMSVLSGLLGSLLPKLFDKRFIHYGSFVLFLIFGIRMLYEGFVMDNREGFQELQEAEAELDKKCQKVFEADSIPPAFAAREMKATPIPFIVNNEKQSKIHRRRNKMLNLININSLKTNLMKFLRLLNPCFVQTFTLTFLAEWGDRSQISTIALSAYKDFLGVNIGAVAGHACCTGIAVAGGKLLASSISERVVALSGGVLFIVFSISGLLFDV